MDFSEQIITCRMFDIIHIAIFFFSRIKNNINFFIVIAGDYGQINYKIAFLVKRFRKMSLTIFLMMFEDLYFFKGCVLAIAQPDHFFVDFLYFKFRGCQLVYDVTWTFVKKLLQLFCWAIVNLELCPWTFRVIGI
jgi:hypothetical protein